MEKYTKEELIGQKFLVGFDGKKVDEYVTELITKYKVGGFILYRNNYDTYFEMISLIKELKEVNRVNKIPLFICVDQENGIVNRLPSEFHRIKNALASSKCNKDVIKEVGDITSEILHRSGINMNLSPTCDIYDENISKSIGNRCFGVKATDVIKNTRIIIDSHKENKVIPIIKHYPGLRQIKVDTHIFLPSIKSIDKEDIKPFNTFMEEKVPGMLLSHIIVKDKDRLPVSLSRKVQNEIKEKYDGITITDDIKMRSVRYRYGYKRLAKLAIESGNDIIMFNFNETNEVKTINRFYKLYNKHSKEIEDSALKIINLKKEYKISDKDFEELSVDEINEYNDRIDKVNEIIVKKNS